MFKEQLRNSRVWLSKYWREYRVPLIVGFILGMLATAAVADTVSVSWTHPTQYIDGTALPTSDIKATEVECLRFRATGATSDAPCAAGVNTLLGSGTALTVDLGAVPATGGAYTFVARTLTLNGEKSANSGEVSKVYLPVPQVPSPPSDVRVAQVPETPAPDPEPVACTGTQDLRLVHADDFEYKADGDYIDSTKVNPDGRWMVSDDFDASVDKHQTVSTKRARYGTRSALSQLTFHNGTTWYKSGTEPPHRNEVAIKKSAAAGFTDIAQRWEREYLYAFSVYLPDENDPNGDPAFPSSIWPGYMILWQSHHAPDACDTNKNPTIAFDFGATSTPQTSPRSVPSDSLLVWNIWDPNQCSAGTSTVQRWNTGKWLSDRGRWTDYVIHWIPSVGPEGLLEVWKNDVKVLTRKGPSTRNDAVLNNMKFGLYTGWGNLSKPPPVGWPKQIRVYHDEIKFMEVIGGTKAPIDTNSCAYQAVAPRGPRT